MRQRQRRSALRNTVIPLSSLLHRHEDDNRGEQEGTIQETNHEGPQTTSVLSRHRIQDYIFYLPPYYRIDKIIGCGAFGTVAAGEITSTNRPVAIKKITLNLESSSNDEENLHQWKSVYRELSLLRQLSETDRHPNVIMLEDVFYRSMSTQCEIMLSTNLMDKSLDTLMKSKPLTDREKQRYIHQIFYGLDYLHSKNIIHRDLKPTNVLINGENLCIADLGQARVAEILRDEVSVLIGDDINPHQLMTTNGIGTYIYRAPELNLNYPTYSYPIDLWSAGCIFGEMFFDPHQTLFTGGQQGDNLFEYVKEVFQLIGTLESPDDIEWLTSDSAIFVRSQCSAYFFPPGWNNLPIQNGIALDLLKKLLVFNPSGRITARNTLQHEYFSSAHLPYLQVVPIYSTTAVTSTVDLNRLTTTQEVQEAIIAEIKLMRHTD